VKAGEWLESDEENREENMEEFERTDFEDPEKGRLLFELQKSFGGDKRFRLGKEFLDDIEEKKLPEKVKLSIASANVGKLQHTEDDRERTRERDHILDILQQVVPDADLRIKKDVKEFKAVARFDPRGTFASQLTVKANPPVQTHAKNSKVTDQKKIAPAPMAISKGIDKKNASINRANEILAKSAQKYLDSSTNPSKKTLNSKSGNPHINGQGGERQEVKRKIVKEIKRKKWEEISKEKETLKEFKLFE